MGALRVRYQAACTQEETRIDVEYRGCAERLISILLILEYGFVIVAIEKQVHVCDMRHMM